MVNENEKHSYLSKMNPRLFVVIEKTKKHISGYIFRFEIYLLNDSMGAYNEFTLRNVGEVFGYRFDDVYREICRHLYHYMNC